MIIPSMTFLSVAFAIKAAKAIPVFVDVDSDSYTTDPESMDNVINPRTKAAIPVHLYGQIADMDRIVDLADKNNLKIIEDCGQSHSATLEVNLPVLLAIWELSHFMCLKISAALKTYDSLLLKIENSKLNL